jgi:elongation factor P--(R)-beta-lysine ligase
MKEMNLLQTARDRACIIQSIRMFFTEKGFLHVETPSLVVSPGLEPTLEAFSTVYRSESGSFSRKYYLPTSPEFHMKRLLALGFPSIFQICRAYRNGETGLLHNPEFTILEWYRAGSGYQDIMADMEEMVLSICRSFRGSASIRRQGCTIDLSLPWDRLTVKNAWRHYAGIDLDTVEETSKLRTAGQAAGVPHLKQEDSWDVLYFKIFLQLIEPHLGLKKPVILYEYPAPMAILSRLKNSDPTVALRFEVYIAGIELGNAFDELTDPVEQQQRLMHAQEEKRASGRDPFPIDEDFMKALETGLPPCSGIAVGVDRLMMLIMDKPAIQDVLLFPFAEERVR